MLKIDIRHIFLLDNIHSEMVFCAVDFVMRTCNTPHNGVYDCLSRVNEKSLFALNILFESLIMSLLVVGKTSQKPAFSPRWNKAIIWRAAQPVPVPPTHSSPVQAERVGQRRGGDLTRRTPAPGESPTPGCDKDMGDRELELRASTMVWSGQMIDEQHVQSHE